MLALWAWNAECNVCPAITFAAITVERALRGHIDMLKRYIEQRRATGTLALFSATTIGDTKEFRTGCAVKLDRHWGLASDVWREMNRAEVAVVLGYMESVVFATNNTRFR
jgi:hypothetical protein